MKLFNFHIISDKKLTKREKKLFIKGLNLGDEIGYQRCKVDATGVGTILKGYDVNEQVDKILKRKEGD